MKVMQWIQHLFTHQEAATETPGYLAGQAINSAWLQQEEERQLREVKERLDRVEQKLESVLRSEKGGEA